MLLSQSCERNESAGRQPACNGTWTCKAILGPSNSGGWLRARSTWVLLAFLAIAGFFLVTEHTAHVLGVLPFRLLLACPLLHLFLHKGHGAHSAHAKEHAGHTASQPHRGNER